jgi:hypothetical protein
MPRRALYYLVSHPGNLSVIFHDLSLSHSIPRKNNTIGVRTNIIKGNLITLYNVRLSNLKFSFCHILFLKRPRKPKINNPFNANGNKEQRENTNKIPVPCNHLLTSIVYSPMKPLILFLRIKSYASLIVGNLVRSRMFSTSLSSCQYKRPCT